MVTIILYSTLYLIFAKISLEKCRSQEVNDKINQNFSDYMLGIDRYYDPYSEQQVELPSGYKQAWANNLGEYIVSDDPDFNPNQVSNQNWQELERK